MIRALLAAALTLALLACSGGSSTPATTHTVTEPGVAPDPVTNTVTVTATPTPAVKAKRGRLKPGQVFTTSDARAKATILAFNRHGQGSTDRSGYGIAELKVRVCSLGGGTISDAPWGLIGRDGAVLRDAIIGGGLHEPQYPGNDEPVNAGDCIVGWISYETPNDEQIVAAKYVISYDKRPADIAEWSIR